MPYIPTMPKNRTFPALGIALLIPLAAWAQSPSEPAKAPAPAATTPDATPAAPAGSTQAVQAAQTAAAAAAEAPTETETFLDGAIKAIDKLKTVSADIVQKVDMLDQKFNISGRYLKGQEGRIY